MTLACHHLKNHPKTLGDPWSQKKSVIPVPPLISNRRQKNIKDTLKRAKIAAERQTNVGSG